MFCILELNKTEIMFVSVQQRMCLQLVVSEAHYLVSGLATTRRHQKRNSIVTNTSISLI